MTDSAPRSENACDGGIERCSRHLVADELTESLEQHGQRCAPRIGVADACLVHRVRGRATIALCRER